MNIGLNHHTITHSAINPTGMYSQVELITPEIASQYLATMVAEEQRHRLISRVKQYAKQHMEGNWFLTHQGIGFDDEGVLRDGQHRLHMILLTQKPAIMCVTRNVPKIAFLHVDNNLPRSVRDAIKMAGSGDYSSNMVVIARTVHGYPDREIQVPVTEKERIIQLIKIWGDSLDFMENNLPQKVAGISRAVRCCIVRCHAHMTHKLTGQRLDTFLQRLTDFCQVLVNGFVVSDNPDDDSAAICLRNYLKNTLNAVERIQQPTRYRRTQCAIVNFLERVRLRMLKEISGDEFPVPSSMLISE